MVGSQRNEYLDSLKFVLITLVVFGHVIESYLSNRAFLALYNTIYLFHMPLFIFISGYFCKRDTDPKKKLRSILRLVETLIVFQLLHNLLPLFKGDISFIRLFASPAWTMWYLYSLIAWRLMVYLTPPQIYKEPNTLLCITITISLTGGFIPFGGLLSIQRTLTFLPFFFIGYYFRTRQIDITQYNISKPLAICVIITAYIAMLIIDRNMSFILYGSKPYKDPVIICFLLRALQLAAGIIMGISVISVVRTLPERLNGIGRDTLFVYMYHTFLIVILHKVISLLNIGQSFVSTILEFSVVYLAIIVMRKSTVLHYLLNPISNILNNHNK